MWFGVKNKVERVTPIPQWEQCRQEDRPHNVFRQEEQLPEPSATRSGRCTAKVTVPVLSQENAAPHLQAKIDVPSMLIKSRVLTARAI